MINIMLTNFSFILFYDKCGFLLLAPIVLHFTSILFPHQIIYRYQIVYFHFLLFTALEKMQILQLCVTLIASRGSDNVFNEMVKSTTITATQVKFCSSYTTYITFWLHKSRYIIATQIRLRYGYTNQIMLWLHKLHHVMAT